MRTFLIVFLWLNLMSNSFSQNTSWRTKIPVKWATEFEFIHNNDELGCFFFNQRDGYYFLIVDTNYNVVQSFNDSYYTAQPPRYVGSLFTDDKFVFFFRHFQKDLFLIYSLDIKTNKLVRTKDFKISTKPKERIIYSGSDVIGKKIYTFSHTGNSIIFKTLTEDLLIESTSFHLQPKELEYIKESYPTTVSYSHDTIVMVFNKKNLREKTGVSEYSLYTLKKNLTNHLNFIVTMGAR